MSDYKELTDIERSELQKMFWKNNEEIQKQIKEELTILSKYKGELAKNYEQVGAYQNTLVGCMKDIIENQEEIFHMFREVIKVISGNYPKTSDRIDAVEEEAPWK
jgi:predicted transcriptional regulator